MSEIIKLFPNLEERFKLTRRLETPGGKVKILELVPDKEDLEVGAEMKTEVPIIFGLGWGGTFEAYKDFLFALARKGRRIIVFENADHGINPKNNHELQDKGEIPNIEARKVATILGILDTLEIKQADLLGYSEGGIYVALAAYFRKEKVRSLTLANPGGFLKNDSMPRLVKRFLVDMKNHFKEVLNSDEKMDKFEKFFKFYFAMVISTLKDPVKGIQEISAIAHTSTKELVENIRNKLGIYVSIIASPHENTFPGQKVIQNIGKHNLDSFAYTAGGHGNIVMQEKEFARVYEAILYDAENKNSINL